MAEEQSRRQAKSWEEMRHRMEHFEKFCSLNGPAFYRMPPNEDTITLVRKPYKVAERYDFDDAEVLPICAGDELSWSIV